MKNHEEIVAAIFKRNAQSMRLGLDRIAAAAQALGNPQNSFQSIHVAGTNGKGSVCSFLNAMLLSQGYTTGLYSSPHLVRFEERFVIAGKTVTPEKWLAVYHDCEPLIEHYELTFFEIATLIAFELFKREQVEWAVIETGLGGRLDATNICIPRASVITAIGVEHTARLGPDARTIAAEKLGIVKKGIPCICGEQYFNEVYAVAQEICAAQEAPYVPVTRDAIRNVRHTTDGSSFRFRNNEFHVPLQGEYQVANALCALMALERLGVVKEDAMIDGLASAVLPGRFQSVSAHGKQIVFDGAHNPQAINVLCKQLRSRFPRERLCFIFACMVDKDAPAMIETIASIASDIILTRPDTLRAMAPQLLQKMVPEHYNGKVDVVESVNDALHKAIKRVGQGVAVITGSFYLVGEAMEVLHIVPYDNQEK